MKFSRSSPRPERRPDRLPSKHHPILAFFIAPLVIPAVALVAAVGLIIAQGDAADLLIAPTWLVLAALAVLGIASTYLVTVVVAWPIYRVLRHGGKLRRLPVLIASAGVAASGLLLFWHLLVGPTDARWGPLLLLGTGAGSGAGAGWFFCRLVGIGDAGEDGR